MFRIFVFALLTAVSPLAVLFAEGDEAAEPAIEEVVRSQIKALQREDFKAAYGYAHREIKARFTEMEFEQMIREQFRGMLNVAGTDYGVVVVEGRAAQMEVVLTDQAGHRQGYRYMLVDDEGEWRIAGVVPFQAPVQFVLLEGY